MFNMDDLDKKLIDRRYRIVKRLGSGGMGIVYLVEDTLKDNISLALKKIKHDVIKNHKSTGISSLKNEYEIMTRLKHPNLTRVYDFGEDRDNYYIVMEYLTGTLLSTMEIDDLETVLEILVQMLRALEYIHSRNIIYRDIKPDNIMILEKRVKLMDFGISSYLNSEDKERKTRGTLSYISPEALEGKMSFSTDIFSSGIVLYELLSKNRFYEQDENIVSIIINLLSSPDEFNRYQEEKLKQIEDVNLRGIIKKMISYHAADRYDSCSEIIGEINRFLGYNYDYETAETKHSYVLGNAFADRIKEIDCLKNNISVPCNRCRAIIYSGTSGIGKTRLFSEFKKYCILNGISFFEARCMEAGTRQYYAIREILSQMINISSGSILEQYGKYLRLIMPEDERLKDFESPDITDNPALLQDIIVQNITDYIIILSKNQKNYRIIYFDDLQWIDEGSTLILKNLLYRSDLAEGGRQHLVCYANINKDRLPENSSLYGILDMNQVSVHDLTPLDMDGVTEYIENVFGSQFLDESIKESVKSIKDKIGSNPFFLQEFIKSLLDRGIIVKDKRCWRLLSNIDGAHIPHNIIDMVKHKLDLLFEDDNKRKILKILSLLRIDLSVREIKIMLSKIADVDTAQVLLELENLEILKTLKINNIVHYSYNNILIKDQIRKRIEDKPEIDLFLAETLDSIFFDDDDMAEEIAFHYAEGGNIKKAVSYYDKCGDFAQKNYFNNRAMQYYETALNLLQSHDKESSTEIIRIEIKIADLMELTGRLSDSHEMYKRAFALSESIRENTLAVKCMNGMGLVLKHFGKPAEAMEILKKARSIAEKAGDKTGLSNALRIISTLYVNQGEYRKARKCLEEILSICKEFGDKKSIANTVGIMGNNYLFQGDQENAMDCYEQQYQISREIGYKTGIITALNNTGILYSNQGNFKKAMDCFEKYRKANEEIGDKYGISISLSNLGIVYYYIGDYDTAMEYYTKSLTIWREIKNKYNISYAHSNIGLIYYQQGDYTRALRCFDEAIRISSENKARFILSEQLYYKSDLLCEMSIPKEAKSLNDQALKIAKEIDRKDIIFNCRLLSCKIERDIEALKEILEDNDPGINQEQKASIYYELWKMTEEKEYAEKARSIYEMILEKMPKYKFKKRIGELKVFT